MLEPFWYAASILPVYVAQTWVWVLGAALFLDVLLNCLELKTRGYNREGSEIWAHTIHSRINLVHLAASL